MTNYDFLTDKDRQLLRSHIDMRRPLHTSEVPSGIITRLRQAGAIEWIWIGAYRVTEAGRKLAGGNHEYRNTR